MSLRDDYEAACLEVYKAWGASERAYVESDDAKYKAAKDAYAVAVQKAYEIGEKLFPTVSHTETEGT